MTLPDLPQKGLNEFKRTYAKAQRVRHRMQLYILRNRKFFALMNAKSVLIGAFFKDDA